MNNAKLTQTIIKFINEAIVKSVINEFSNFPQEQSQGQSFPSQQVPLQQQQLKQNVDNKPVQIASFMSQNQQLLSLLKQHFGGNVKTQMRQVDRQVHSLDVYMIPINKLRPLVANLSPMSIRLQVKTDENVRNVRLHGNEHKQIVWLRQNQGGTSAPSSPQAQPQMQQPPSPGRQNTIFGQ